MLDRSRQYLLSLIMGTPKSSCSNSAPHFQPLGSLIYFAWHFSMPWRVSRARDQRGQNRQNAPMLWSGMGVAYAPCFFSLMHPDILLFLKCYETSGILVQFEEVIFFSLVHPGALFAPFGVAFAPWTSLASTEV